MDLSNDLKAFGWVYLIRLNEIVKLMKDMPECIDVRVVWLTPKYFKYCQVKYSIVSWFMFASNDTYAILSSSLTKYPNLHS